MEALLKQILEGQKRIEERLDRIENRLSEHSQLISALMRRTEEPNAQVASIAHSVVQLEGRIANLENRMSSLEGSVAVIETRLDNIDRTINSMAGDITFLVRKAADTKTAFANCAGLNKRLLRKTGSLLSCNCERSPAALSNLVLRSPR